MSDVYIQYGHDNDKQAAILLNDYFEKELGHNTTLNITPYIDKVWGDYIILVGGRCANNITCFFVNAPNSTSFCGVTRECNGSLAPLTISDLGKARIDSVSWNGKKFIVVRGYEKEDTFKAIEKMVNEKWSISQLYSKGLSGVIVSTSSNIEPEATFFPDVKSSEYTVGTKIQMSYRLSNKGYSGICGVEFYADGKMVLKKNYRITSGANAYDSYTYTMPNKSYSEMVMIYGHQRLINGFWIFVEDGRSSVTFVKKSEVVVTPPDTPDIPPPFVCASPNVEYGGKCYAPCPDDHEFIAGKCYPKNVPPDTPEGFQLTATHIAIGAGLIGVAYFVTRK